MKSIEFKGMARKDFNIFYDDDADDNVTTALKSRQLFAASNIKFLIELCDYKKDGWYLDIGAHIGTSTIVFDVNDYYVIAIEGSKKNFECLSKTFADSKFVELHNWIVSDKIKSCGYREAGPYSWITKSGDRFSTTVDSIVVTRPILGVKLDIEGGEIEALDGMVETIRKSQPTMLCEINGYCLIEHNHTTNELLNKLDSLGYDVLLMLGSDWIKIRPNDIFPICTIDVVCIHREKKHNSKEASILARYRHLTKEEIDSIAKQYKEFANDQSILYYRSIGYA